MKHAIATACLGGSLDVMKALNTLHYRSQGDGFFHLYTRIVNGLFFEIVQRRNDDRLTRSMPRPGWPARLPSVS